MMTSDHYIGVRAKIGMQKGYYKGDRQLEKKDVHFKRDMYYQDGQEKVFEMLEVGWVSA